jgi:hypothetical protein
MHFTIKQLDQPIDSGWMYLKSIPETLSQLISNSDAFLSANNIDLAAAVSFIEDWQAAKRLAKDNGWEGDFAVEPKVFPSTHDGEIKYGFIIKQSNNGSTFLISPLL